MAEASHIEIVPRTLPLPSVAEQATDAEIVPLRLSFPSDDDDPAPDTRAALFDSKTKLAWVLCVLVGIHLVAFMATMFVNDCGHGECVLRPLGRFSFQPLSENPSLGPSASTLDKMGALKQSLFVDHQTWRLFTSPLLHAGLIHLLVNLGTVTYVGIHLEQKFGPARIGLIYILSALCGSLTAALFLSNRPTVGSSGAMFGLLGAMLTALIRDWKLYKNIQFSAVVSLVLLLAVNLILGLLPLINNFANVGGVIAGVLLGFLLLNSPRNSEFSDHQTGLYEYEYGSNSINLKEKLYKLLPLLAFLFFFVLILAGGVIIANINFNTQNNINPLIYLGIFLIFPMIAGLVIQGEEQDIPMIESLRSLTVLAGNVETAAKEHAEHSEKFNRARLDGISKKRLNKMEKRLADLALARDNARAEFEHTRVTVARHPILDSVEDLQLVLNFLPGVEVVFCSSRLRSSYNRKEHQKVFDLAGARNITLK